MSAGPPNEPRPRRAAPGGYTLRAADAADTGDVSALVHAAYAHYVPRIGGLPGPMQEDYGEVIAGGAVTVAEREAAIAGVLVLGQDEEGFAVENVAVHPGHQRQGLGSRLLEQAESEALARGFDSIHLYTHRLMSENRALYSRRGYVEYEPRARRHAALVYMRKSLREGPASETQAPPAGP
jgi:GNAT superfamily N-acetyltransferase